MNLTIVDPRFSVIVAGFQIELSPPHRSFHLFLPFHILPDK